RDFHVTGVQTCALPISPQELAEQHALAQRVISDIEDDHSGLSVRTEGWYRVLVVGSTPEEAKQKVSMLQEMYAPRIRLEHEHGQIGRASCRESSAIAAV